MWWIDPKDRDRRETDWFLFEEAEAAAIHKESKELLRLAHERGQTSQGLSNPGAVAPHQQSLKLTATSSMHSVPCDH